MNIDSYANTVQPHSEILNNLFIDWIDINETNGLMNAYSTTTMIMIFP
jgi:hypothetical protein